MSEETKKLTPRQDLQRGLSCLYLVAPPVVAEDMSRMVGVVLNECDALRALADKLAEAVEYFHEYGDTSHALQQLFEAHAAYRQGSQPQ